HLFAIGEGAAFGTQLLAVLDDAEGVATPKSFLARAEEDLVADPNTVRGFPDLRPIPVDILDGEGTNAEGFVHQQARGGASVGGLVSLALGSDVGGTDMRNEVQAVSHAAVTAATPTAAPASRLPFPGTMFDSLLRRQPVSPRPDDPPGRKFLLVAVSLAPFSPSAGTRSPDVGRGESRAPAQDFRRSRTPSLEPRSAGSARD